MKPTTLEWIHQAEEDWHVAQMSYRVRKHPSYDAAVFHAQQCAEKYLKARLEEAAIGFARTHDLLLHQLVLSVEPNWQGLQTHLTRRHHVDPSVINKAIKVAVRRAGLTTHSSAHTLRHAFATHLLQRGTDIHTMQHLLGHNDVATTMISTHILQQGG